MVEVTGLEPTANFNSHAHVERDRERSRTPSKSSYFNSHAHVERDMCVTSDLNELRISTHTLTWSVTNFYLVKLIVNIFQLTRSRGA